MSCDPILLLRVPCHQVKKLCVYCYGDDASTVCVYSLNCVWWHHSVPPLFPFFVLINCVKLKIVSTRCGHSTNCLNVFFILILFSWICNFFGLSADVSLHWFTQVHYVKPIVTKNSETYTDRHFTWIFSFMQFHENANHSIWKRIAVAVSTLENCFMNRWIVKATLSVLILLICNIESSIVVSRTNCQKCWQMFLDQSRSRNEESLFKLRHSAHLKPCSCF